jgi:hypothetical protein
VSVRLAAPADEDRLFAFVLNADEEMPVGAKDEKRVRQIVHSAVHGRLTPEYFPPRFGVIGDASLEAAIGLYADQPWYSTEYVMTAFFIFVHPDHRKVGHLSALRKFSAAFASAAGMKLSLRVNGDDAKVRMLGRGAQSSGAIFVMGEAA